MKTHFTNGARASLQRPVLTIADELATEAAPGPLGRMSNRVCSALKPNPQLRVVGGLISNFMKNIHWTRFSRFALGVAIALPLLAGGCTQVQVAPNVQGEYKLGELQVFADRDFAAVHAAATRGMKDAGLFQTRDDRKVIEAELNGRDAADTLVIVKIKEVGQNRTSIKIRYGLKGDLASAQKLYQAMQKYL